MGSAKRYQGGFLSRDRAVLTMLTMVGMLAHSALRSHADNPRPPSRRAPVPDQRSDDDGPVLIDPNAPKDGPDLGSPAVPPGRSRSTPFRPGAAGPSFESIDSNDPTEPTVPEPDRNRSSPGFPRDPFRPHPLAPRTAPPETLRNPGPRGYLPPQVPPEGDYSMASLQRCQDALRRRYGATDRDIPPAEKAEFLQWVLTRYHKAPYHLVHHSVNLPDEPGLPPEYTFGDDVSTWNGALLAAMSYKYAVTRDPETLALIIEIVDGLHLCQQVTGRRGLPARCVLQSDVPVLRANRKYVAPDGTPFHYRSDAAKGTFNQIVAGYALMLMLVSDDLPPETRDRARHDMSEMVTHLLDHKFRITEADGKKTSYGDLTPLIGPISVPFNAQLAYMMVASAYQFPGQDAVAWKMARTEFKRLRQDHHVYFEDPLRVAITPQQAAGGPFVKGMNDRNHVMTASYVGLMLELDAARKMSRLPDRQFLFELGQTMAWTIQQIQSDRNALCNFEWAGLLRDPYVFESIVPAAQRPNALRQLDRLVSEGIEQIRRAPIERFYRTGQKVETREPQWIDAQRPDEVYCWKVGAMNRWEITGPTTNHLSFGTDYLHAYWLMRYFRIAGE
ncbi:MAG: hypothetical protein IT428_18895 [Planctomycetaceae bacterium]|nr:hypothetical protein [Planctomycetaceae bacterium]